MTDRTRIVLARLSIVLAVGGGIAYAVMSAVVGAAQAGVYLVPLAVGWSLLYATGALLAAAVILAGIAVAPAVTRWLRFDALDWITGRDKL